MKKILILTVTAGNGHNSCAIAMKQKLESMGENEVKIVDILKIYSSRLNKWTADGGYSLAMAYLPKPYEIFFNMYKKAPAYKRYSCMGQKLSLSVVNGLYKEINEFKPDVIYCTHFYASVAITDIKLVYKLPCKTIIPVLDYENSPFWEAGIGVDYLALPNEDFIKEFISEGYTKEQIVCTGIPIKEQFFKEIDKKQAKKELGLDEDMFTAMVIFGGGNWSGGLKIFKKLTKCVDKEKLQIIMINGRNKKDYKKVAKMRFKDNVKVVNIGFTDKVDLYMSASDVVLGKMGGLSSTEMINKKLPMLITSKVYAQEKNNLKYLEEKGIAKSFKNQKELKTELLKLMKDSVYYNEKLEKMIPLRRNGVDSLAKLIIEQPNAVYDDEYISTIDYRFVKKNVKKVLKKLNKQSIREHKKVKEIEFNDYN